MEKSTQGWDAALELFLRVRNGVVSLNCRDEVLPRNTTPYELHKGRKSSDCLTVQAGG